MKIIKEQVTIIIPCYNGRNFIKQCFSAILKQTYKNLEIIFVDDGSDDNSFIEAKQWEQKFNNVGINLICLKKENGGAASAVNTAFTKLSGEYFEVLDIDDYIYPQNIECKVRYLNEHPEIMFVRNDGEIYNIQKKEVVSHFCIRDSEKRTYNIFEELLFGKTYNWAGTFLIRTEAFIDVNKGMEIYNSRYGQNMQLLLPVAYYSKCGFVKEILTRYNEYPSSTSHDLRYNKNLALLEGYEDIRINVLSRLQLINEKKLGEIKQFYLRKKMELAATFNYKDGVKIFYNQLTNKSWRDLILYLRVKYSIVDVGFKKIVRIIKRD